MNKITKIILAVVGGVIGLGAIVGVLVWLLMAQGGGNPITEEQAKEIAFAHASVEEADVIMREIKLDRYDFKQTYDIKFHVDAAQYEYAIDAKTGHIEDFDVDGLRAANYSGTESAAVGQEPTTQIEAEPVEEQVPNTKGETGIVGEDVQISEAEAAKTVLAKVPGASESNLWIKIDTEDGRVIYEGEIIYDGMEYEFEMDANDGTILSWETDGVEADDMPHGKNYSEEKHHVQ